MFCTDEAGSAPATMASKYFRVRLRTGLLILVSSGFTQQLLAQQGFTWEQIRDRFRTANPTLLAGEINVEESRAQQITAYLRPNPLASASLDQIGNTAEGNNIFAASTSVAFFSYL